MSTKTLTCPECEGSSWSLWVPGEECGTCHGEATVGERDRRRCGEDEFAELYAEVGGEG